MGKLARPPANVVDSSRRIVIDDIMSPWGGCGANRLLHWHLIRDARRRKILSAGKVTPVDPASRRRKCPPFSLSLETGAQEVERRFAHVFGVFPAPARQSQLSYTPSPPDPMDGRPTYGPLYPNARKIIRNAYVAPDANRIRENPVMVRPWMAVPTLNLQLAGALRDHHRAFRLLNADGSVACALDGRDSEVRQLPPRNKRGLPRGRLWGTHWLSEPVHLYPAGRNLEAPFLGIAATSRDPCSNWSPGRDARECGSGLLGSGRAASRSQPMAHRDAAGECHCCTAAACGWSYFLGLGGALCT